MILKNYIYLFIIKLSMVTKEEIEERRSQIRGRLNQLTQFEQEASGATGEEIPQRRFRSGVTREQQQQVLFRRTQARQVIGQVSEERIELQREESTLNEQLELIKDYEKARKVFFSKDARQVFTLNKRQREIFQDFQRSRRFAERKVERRFEEQGLSPIIRGGKIVGVIDVETGRRFKGEEIINFAQENEVNRSRLENLGLIETNRREVESEPQRREEIIKSTITGIQTPLGFLKRESLNISQRRAELLTRRARGEKLNVQERGELAVQAGVQSSLETAIAIKGAPKVIRTVIESPKESLANVKTNIAIGITRIKSGEISTKLIQQPEVITGKLVSTILETVLLSKAISKGISLFKKPVRITTPPIKPESKSVDIIKQVGARTFKAQFVIVTKVPPRVSFVQTRADILKEKALGAFRPQKGLPIITKTGKFVQVQKPFTSITVSEKFLIRDGRVSKPVAIISARERGKITLSALRGSFKPSRKTVLPIREIDIEQIRKLGFAIQPKVEIVKGKLISLEVLRATRAGKVIPSKALRPITIADLTAFIKKIAEFKTKGAEITLFRTETLIKSVDLQKLIRRKFIVPPRRLKEISGITVLIEPKVLTKRLPKIDLRAQTINKVTQLTAAALPRISKVSRISQEKIISSALGKTIPIESIIKTVGLIKPLTKISVIQKTTPLVKTIPISSTRNIIVTKVIQKSLPRAITKSLPKLGIKTVSKTIPKTLTRTIPKLTTKTITKVPPRIPAKFPPKTPTIVRVPIKIIPPFKLRQERKALQIESPKSLGFKTFVIKGGKRFFLAGIRPKSEALRIGAVEVKQSLRATFGIVPTSISVPKSRAEFRPSSQIFRQFRIRRGIRQPLQEIFIQRTRKEGGLRGGRLSFREEIRDIQRAMKVRKLR